MVVACYAAIDIGSNSIRMEAAEVTPEGSLIEVASDRQVTRLGESVFRTGRVSPAAIDFACDVLASMAQKYRTVNAIAVRAVGTSALRDASNKDEFLRRASDVLGTNVEVISGLEGGASHIHGRADPLAVSQRPLAGSSTWEAAAPK